MDLASLVPMADTLQTLSGVISFVGYLPQVVTLYRKKDSGGMSLSSWLLWIVAWGFALFYASINYLNTGTGLPLLFGAMISTLFVVLISVMIARYQPVEQKAQARVRVRRVISGLAAIRTGGPQ